MHAFALPWPDRWSSFNASNDTELAARAMLYSHELKVDKLVAGDIMLWIPQLMAIDAGSLDT